MSSDIVLDKPDDFWLETSWTHLPNHLKTLTSQVHGIEEVVGSIPSGSTKSFLLKLRSDQRRWMRCGGSAVGSWAPTLDSDLNYTLFVTAIELPVERTPMDHEQARKAQIIDAENKPVTSSDALLNADRCAKSGDTRGQSIWRMISSFLYEVEKEIEIWKRNKSH